MGQKVIIITGASRGIGAATALLAAQQNYAVCVNYAQDAQAAQAVVKSITQRGGQALAVQADITSETQVDRLFSIVDAQLGRLDVLVNNAGILERSMPVVAMDLQRWQRVFATNVLGSFLCARAAILRMSTQRGGGGGAIVNVSSVAARLGSPHEFVDYAASKGAIDSFTVGLAKEVAPEGIRVNAVRPGIIYTDIHASSGVPDRVDKLKQAVPMQRGGTAQEVAQAILWLASSESAYCTGTFIDVSGGR